MTVGTIGYGVTETDAFDSHIFNGIEISFIYRNCHYIDYKCNFLEVEVIIKK